MNKGLIIASVLFVALALALVSAENSSDKGRNGSDDSNDSRVSDDESDEVGDDSLDDVNEDSNESEFEDDNEVEVEHDQERNRTRLNDNKTDAETEFQIEVENEGNKSKIHVQLSNGRNAEIKIMPDSASLRALERLGLKVCNESNNCTIQLKETGKGNQTRASYEVQVERHFKLLGLFETKAKVRAEVDAESGNVTSVGKPWWSFLASEKEE